MLVALALLKLLLVQDAGQAPAPLLAEDTNGFPLPLPGHGDVAGPASTSTWAADDVPPRAPVASSSAAPTIPSPEADVTSPGTGPSLGGTRFIPVPVLAYRADYGWTAGLTLFLYEHETSVNLRPAWISLEVNYAQQGHAISRSRGSSCGFGEPPYGT